MICVIANVELAKGRREEFLAVMRRLVPTVLAEAGCLEYGPMIDVPSGIPGQQPLRGDTVTVVEKWRDLSALAAHLTTPHFQQFLRDTELLRVGVSLNILQPA